MPRTPLDCAFTTAIAVCVWCSPFDTPSSRASVASFETNSLIIPMDTDYQDFGMLKAFGMVYALLQDGIAVSWVVDPEKAPGGTDLTTSAVDVQTDAVIDNHAYRGGPFVIAAEDATAAMVTIESWHNTHVTTVHKVSAPFSAFVSKQLVAPPTIAVFADGNEDIAFKYLNAAAIPDSAGQAWPDKKDGDKIYPGYPDVLNVEEVAGTQDPAHNDGALFDEKGNAAYCQIMTMHWGVNEVVDEVVAEMRTFLSFPVHLFAECQAVNALENNIHGKFLTPNGFEIDDKPDDVDFHNAGYAFAQMDGEWGVVGGSEPSYSLPDGDEYLDADIVMVTEAGTPFGTRDVWMTGFIDGICQVDDSCGIEEIKCDAGVGKVSYLGGHSYKTDLPMSENPESQGTRVFLNSLFEADCATAKGQPVMSVSKSGAGETVDGLVTWTMTVSNAGPSVAQNVIVSDTFPADVVITDTDPVATLDVALNTVTWDLGSMAGGDSISVTVSAQLPELGAYTNIADVTYKVGLAEYALQSNAASVTYSLDSDGDGCSDAQEVEQGTLTDVQDTDGDGALDCDDLCPTISNPLQNLITDSNHCGECGKVCSGEHVVTAVCTAAACVAQDCEPGWEDADGDFSNGCESPAGGPGADAGPDAVGDEAVATEAGADSVGTDASGADSSGGGDAATDPGTGVDVGEDNSTSGGCDCRTGSGVPPTGSEALFVVILGSWMVRRRRDVPAGPRGTNRRTQ